MKSQIVADSLALHSGKSDRREWHTVGSWLHPGERIVIVRACDDAREPELRNQSEESLWMVEASTRSAETSIWQKLAEIGEFIKGGLSSVAVVSVGNVDHLANARLIAAAPELLEALRPFANIPVEAFDKQDKPDYPLMAWNAHKVMVADVLAARTAIAKATGGNDE